MKLHGHIMRKDGSENLTLEGKRRVEAEGHLLEELVRI